MFKCWSERSVTLCGLVLLSAALAACAQMPSARPAALAPTEVRIQAPTVNEAGRYFILLGGCNDCHTPGWEQSGGQMPESEWLTGGRIGYRGPWGTTYASNLRLFVQRVTEDQWVEMFRTREERPPMPWMNYRTINESDLRAAYRFIRDLGPKGEEAPAFVPPDQKPATPYLFFVPRMPNE